jgi:radical SAM protein with 4Fe4S-binding SPASM domain
MPTDRSIIDVASGGALVDKTPEVACQLILNMAAKSKHFGTHGDFPNKQVNEVSISNFENKVNNLTSLVCSLACGNVQQVKVCSTCSLLRICAQQCKKITLNKLMQLMENSMDNPNVSMIPFTTRTIPD